MRSCVRRPEDCRKRLYDSADHARRANSTSSFRLRVYAASGCCGRSGYHVANADKAAFRQPFKRNAPRPKGRRRPLSLAPARTLAEVEQLAAQRRARG